MNANAEQLNNEGVQYFLKGKFSDAKRKYEQALELSPSHTTTLNNLGMVFLQEKEYKLAEDYFKKAISITEKASYLANLGHVYANQNELGLAEQQYIKAIEKDQRSVSAHKSLASLYQFTGNYENSISIWNYILAELSSDAQFKINLAKDHIQLKNYVLAMELLMEVAQQDIYNHIAYYYISWIQLHHKNYGLATESIYRALGIEPNNISYRKLAATLHMSLSEFEKANKHWDFILNIDENQHATRIDKAIALLSIKRFDEALNELNRVLGSEEKNAKALFYKATVLLEIKETDQARELFNELSNHKNPFQQKAKTIIDELNA